MSRWRSVGLVFRKPESVLIPISEVKRTQSFWDRHRALKFRRDVFFGWAQTETNNKTPIFTSEERKKFREQIIPYVGMLAGFGDLEKVPLPLFIVTEISKEVDAFGVPRWISLHHAEAFEGVRGGAFKDFLTFNDLVTTMEKFVKTTNISIKDGIVRKMLIHEEDKVRLYSSECSEGDVFDDPSRYHPYEDVRYPKWLWNLNSQTI